MQVGLDNLTFWLFQIFRPLLLTCYIPMPLMQTHMLDGKRNLLGHVLEHDHSRSGAIYGIWGLIPTSSMFSPLPYCGLFIVD